MHRNLQLARLLGPIFLAAAASDAGHAAGTISVAWDPVPEATGYRVYFGTAPGQYTDSVDVGQATETTLTGLADCTTYYVAVKSYNGAGESAGFSNEIAGWPRPRIEGVAPASVQQGSRLTLVVSGANFQSGAVLETDNPWVFFESPGVPSCGEVQVAATVEPTAPGARPAPIGRFDLTLVNPDGVFGSAPDALEVSVDPARFDVDQREEVTRGRLDGRDTIWIARHFGAAESDPLYDPNADLNGDGWIDGDDLAYVASNLGRCWNGFDWAVDACPASLQ